MPMSGGVFEIQTTGSSKTDGCKELNRSKGFKSSTKTKKKPPTVDWLSASCSSSTNESGILSPSESHASPCTLPRVQGEACPCQEGYLKYKQRDRLKLMAARNSIGPKALSAPRKRKKTSHCRLAQRILQLIV